MTLPVFITPLETFPTVGGQVKHVIKAFESPTHAVQEVYTTSIECGVVRSWKRHKSATGNLVVIVGKVKFVVKTAPDEFTEFVLSPENYSRLTISPGYWFGFKGLAQGSSLIINCSNMVHTKQEAEACPENKFDYNWDL